MSDVVAELSWPGLPANVQSLELLLVGALIEQPRRFYVVQSLVRGSDFFLHHCRLFVEALEEADETGELVAAIEIAEERFRDTPRATRDEHAMAENARVRVVPLVLAAKLQTAGRLGKLPIEQFARWAEQLELNTPVGVKLEETARAISDMSRVRKLESACRTIAAEARDDVRDPAGLLGSAVERVTSIALHTEEESSRAELGDIVRDRFAQMQRDAEDHAKGIVRTVTTGLRTLDDATCGGMRDRQLWVLAGRPGAGKTALSLNMAVNAAAKGHGVLYYSLEMGRAELHDRMVSSESGVPLSALRKPAITDADWPAIMQAAQFLASLPIVVDEQAAIPIGHLRARAVRDARAWRGKRGNSRLRVIVVDYLQKVTAPHLPKNASREQHVAAVVSGLKDLAKELDVCVVALAQMGRESEKTSRDPRLSDLRESGAIEAEGDLVAFLTSDDKTDQRVVDVHIAKQRDGSPGMYTLHFDGPHVRFHDVDRWGA